MNNNKTAKIISFIFPLIGLIIYAVNVGKNDTLAKDCLKWALIGMFSLIILVVLFFIIMYLSYNFNISRINKTIKVPVAKITIKADEIITKDMIEFIEVKPSLIENNEDSPVIDDNLIIGKTVNMFCIIPKGSQFYKNCLE